MSNKTLNNGAFLFFAILMAGLAANFFFTKNYALSNSQVISQFDGQDYFMTYDQLHGALTTGKTADFFFVDLRSEEAFAQSQIPGAVNVPFGKLLERKNLKRIHPEKNQVLVLYGDDEATAQKARLLLLSRGMKEILIIGGTFEDARMHAMEHFDPAFAYFRDEKARFDYLRFMQGGAASGPAEKPAAAIPQANQQPVAAAGGC